MRWQPENPDRDEVIRLTFKAAGRPHEGAALVKALPGLIADANECATGWRERWAEWKAIHGAARPLKKLAQARESIGNAAKAVATAGPVFHLRNFDFSVVLAALEQAQSNLDARIHYIEHARGRTVSGRPIAQDAGARGRPRDQELRGAVEIFARYFAEHGLDATSSADGPFVTVLIQSFGRRAIKGTIIKWGVTAARTFRAWYETRRT